MGPQSYLGESSICHTYKAATKKSDSNKPIQEFKYAQQDRRTLSYKNSLAICFQFALNPSHFLISSLVYI